VATLPGKTEPGKECLITAHYDSRSEISFSYAPGADDNASGTAAVLTAADILKDYDFDYTIKFIGFAGEEQGLLGSDAYAYKAQQRGDTIIGVYNLDMTAWEGDDNNIIELHAGTGASSQALADIMIGVINDYSIPLVPQKITSGATGASDHASFWDQGYPAILGIEDMVEDFNPAYHTTGDRISIFDMPYFTDFAKAGIASLAILAQPIKPYAKGDANGDGKVTVSDVVYIINYLFKGGPPPGYLDVADVNCDSKVTISDVVYLINYLFKDGRPPPC
jgi:Zn-dependent M28 family amino/carboxypeptidase